MQDTSDKEQTTHFGFKEVPVKDKSTFVADVFHSVANRYDLMNDVMSLGLHRWWKKIALQECQVRAGQTVLDLAGGTGDLAHKLSERVGKSGYVVLADINESMLRLGRDRLIDQGRIGNLGYAQADAEALPFADNMFDCITIAFGLRNVTDKKAALSSIYRILKPGGRLLILEFSKPILPILNKLYDGYSFNIIPKLGKWICQDETSYQYLVESIRMHPDQDTLKAMVAEAGFEEVSYQNLTGGIVALHKGFKF